MGRAIHQIGPSRPDRLLARIVLGAVLMLIVLPILAGVWQTLRAAMGLMPTLGATRAGLDAFRDLMAIPGLPRAVLISLWTGWRPWRCRWFWQRDVASAGMTAAGCSACWRRCWPRPMRRWPWG